MRGYGMLGFFEDRPGSVLWTYKIGLVRCIFLEESYGKGTIERILEASPLLAGDVAGRARLPGFPALLQALTGLARARVGEVRRVDQAPHDAELPPRASVTGRRRDPRGPARVHRRRDVVAERQLIAVRTLEIDTGQSQLHIWDYRKPGFGWRVAIERRARRRVDAPVRRQELRAVERRRRLRRPVGGRRRPLRRRPRAPRREGRSRGRGRARGAAPRQHDAALAHGRVEAPRGRRRRPRRRARVWLCLGKRGLLAAYAPAFSPTAALLPSSASLCRCTARPLRAVTRRAAGRRNAVAHHRGRIRRARRRAGKSGIIFTSDRNRHGKHNLFRVRPEAKAPIIPLVDEPREHLTPMVTEDGRTFFVAYADARANLYEVTDTKVVQRTDFATALFDPGPGPDGGIWGLFHHGGERRIVKVAKDKLLDLDAEAPKPELFAALDQGDRPSPGLDGASDYRASDLENWHLDNIFALAGFGGGYLYGRSSRRRAIAWPTTRSCCSCSRTAPSIDRRPARLHQPARALHVGCRSVPDAAVPIRPLDPRGGHVLHVLRALLRRDGRHPAIPSTSSSTSRARSPSAVRRSRCRRTRDSG